MACCEVSTCPATVDPHDLALSTVPVCFSTASYSLHDADRPPTPYRDHSPSLPLYLIEDNLTSFEELLAIRRSITPGPFSGIDGDYLEMTAADQLSDIPEGPEKIADVWEAYINKMSPTGNEDGENSSSNVSLAVIETALPVDPERSILDSPITPAMASTERLELDEDLSHDTSSPRIETLSDASWLRHSSRVESIPDPDEDSRAALTGDDGRIYLDDAKTLYFYNDDVTINPNKKSKNSSSFFDPNRSKPSAAVANPGHVSYMPDIKEGKSRERPIVIQDDNDDRHPLTLPFRTIGGEFIRSLSSKYRKTPASVRKSSNTSSRAMVSKNASPMKLRNTVDAFDSIATASIDAHQEIRDSLSTCHKDMQRRHERLDEFLRRSHDQLCRRRYKKSHRIFVEHIQDLNRMIRKDLECMRDCVAKLE